MKLPVYLQISWAGGIMVISTLTHRPLVTPYGDRDLGQLWPRYWLVAWRHQAITWTNVDSSTLKSYNGIHPRALSWEDLKINTNKGRMKFEFSKSHPDLPGTNELTLLHFEEWITLLWTCLCLEHWSSPFWFHSMLQRVTSLVNCAHISDLCLKLIRFLCMYMNFILFSVLITVWMHWSFIVLEFYENKYMYMVHIYPELCPFIACPFNMVPYIYSTAHMQWLWH